MPDTTPDTPTCPRHTRRPADPVLCRECAEQARDAIWKLPTQHDELLAVEHATPTRLERRSAGGPPPSPNRWFDHADEIARALQYWAGHWADTTGRTLPLNAEPGRCARLLLDDRHGNPLEHPDAAAQLADHMLHLHRQAAKLLVDVDEPPKTTRRRAAGPCPDCGMCTLHRTPDSDRIRCDNCPASLSADEYAAHARALVDAHHGAA